MRLRPLFWIGSLGALACSAPSNTSAQVEEAQQAIVDGYVDDETHGIVGVGISVGAAFSSWHCSGTLIAPNLVLTARHCVSMSGQGGVVCGETGFGGDGPGSIFRITPVSPRPDIATGEFVYAGTADVAHVPGGNDLCGGDMALIILDENVPADVATPIVPRIDLIAQRDEPLSAAGFGLTDPDGQGNNIRYRLDDEKVTCVGDDCLNLGGNDTYPTEFQASARTCPGDSGGPALDADGKVIGVLSRGPQGCLWSLYGNVGSWGGFIIETAIEAATIGNYAAPFWTSGSSATPEINDPCKGIDESDADNPVPWERDCGSSLICNVDPETDEGICAPTCAEKGECPEDLECDVENGVCVDPASLIDPDEVNTDGGPATELEGGCSVDAGAESKDAWSWLAALAALGMAAVGRRRINRTQ